MALTIKLTESVVFLTDGQANQSPGNVLETQEQSRPSLLRGLLTLTLTKPTRISSIEIELLGKSYSSWLQAAGARTIEIIEDHTLYSASTVFFSAPLDSHISRRTASVGPGLTSQEVRDRWFDYSHNTVERHNERYLHTHAPPGRRTASVEGFGHQSAHHDDLRTELYHSRLSLSNADADRNTSTSSTSSLRSASTLLGDGHPAHSLEQSRNALRAEMNSLSVHSANSSDDSPLPESGANLPIYRQRPPSSPPTYHRPSLTVSPLNSRSPSLRTVPITPRGGSPSKSRSASSTRYNDRHHSRFSISSMFGALKDSVGVTGEPERRGRSFDGQRGRTLAKEAPERVEEEAEFPENDKEGPGRRIPALDRVSALLRIDGEGSGDSSDGWMEFKKGVYTYPISFTIPGSSPPTLVCPFGSVTWRLKAQVHRPGAFTPKLTAVHDVILVATPGEEDTEESDNIIVERLWDDQLQYIITISGKSFPIGGHIPVSFILMPLEKVNVYRISILLEERIDYYTELTRISRSDPLSIFSLLKLRNLSKTSEPEGEPLLPLKTSLESSPLYAMLSPSDDSSEVAASFMGPGPWTFHHDVQVPADCTQLRPTNKNRKSNIAVHHVLKIILRVQRGDNRAVDARTGRKKLYDIVVQMPVHILSCRCNWESSALPHYSSFFTGGPSTTQLCPCEVKRRSRSRGRDSSSPRRGSHTRYETMYEQNTQFERLVSGQESEYGEPPPRYDKVVQ